MDTSTKKLIRKRNPIESASFLSQCLFWWMKDIFKFGFSNPIEEEHLYASIKSHKSGILTDKFTELWTDEIKRDKPSLSRVIWKMYGVRSVIMGILYSLIDSSARICQPLCLGGLVSYFAQGQTVITKNEAYYYAVGIIICTSIPVFIFHPYFFNIIQIGMKTRIACCSLIYRKTLKLTKSVSIDGLSGKVINIMSNDAAKFDTAIGFVTDLYKGPVELLVLGYFIYNEIGISGLYGIGFMLLFIPLQIWMGKKSGTYRMKTAERTDTRVRLMNEIIHGIQVIKMYAWEKSFANIVDDVRKLEIKAIKGTLLIRGVLLAFSIVSRCSIFLTLISYIYYKNIFNAKQVYITTAYFHMLYSSMLYFWPVSLISVSEAFVSIKRIQEFLLHPEKKLKPKELKNLEKNGNLMENGHKNGETEQFLKINKKNEKNSEIRRIVNVEPVIKGIAFKRATAYWSNIDFTTGINCIDLTINENELCVIIGPVGSGKTTLLQVILGELDLDDGSLVLNGKISYASQDTWLFEGSIKSNIIFIEEFDVNRYNEVIRVCALERDIELFPHGDSTIVGERGVSLSGGQRARISLARAIYRQADIYLLDDPLSAVDTHVGKHIFEKCILQFLKGKTCVLVTHQLQYLNEIKHVVLMNLGHIESQGTYTTLKANKSFFVLSSYMNVDQTNKIEDPIIDCESVNDLKVKANVELSKETQMLGSIGFKVYKSYFTSVNSILTLIWVTILFLLTQICTSAIDYLVAKWVNKEDKFLLSIKNSTTQEIEEIEDYREHHILMYSISMSVLLLLTLQRSFSFFKMCLRASRNLHDKLFRSITRATMYFFNQNPSGRILNRFSQDIGYIDTKIPIALVESILFFLESFAIVVLVAIVNYWLLIPTFLVSVIFYMFRQIYVNTTRSIKRLEALTRSPIFSHANATLQGLVTIRALKAQTVLSKEFNAHQDVNTSSFFLYLSATRAFALWLEIFCVIYIATVTLSFLIFGNNNILSGNVGLAITQTMNLIFMCQWGMRQTAELENQMISVERVDEYTKLTPEAALESEPKYRPPDNWPMSGSIKFVNLYLKYSNDDEYILNDLSFNIKSREKIGIVGRTGAGKSSIIQALFRLAHNEGIIEIDDINIETIGLHELRSKISIIPQDPILFTGSIRSNLDPFHKKKDEELWNVLEEVKLKTTISSFPEGLESYISDGGSNFSSGQRQLVCLARAIIQNNNILILDEATANVDPETDGFIQKTIRTKFIDCTVITIAHRLHTVMDNDRVLVMDAGKIVEFSHPYELLKKSGGILKSFVDQTGISMASQLFQIAEDNYEAVKKSQ